MKRGRGTLARDGEASTIGMDGKDGNSAMQQGSVNQWGKGGILSEVSGRARRRPGRMKRMGGAKHVRITRTNLGERIDWGGMCFHSLEDLESECAIPLRANGPHRYQPRAELAKP
jgi:hypothetical protein